MPWEGDKFLYTTGLLKAIAKGYISIHEALELSPGNLITNPWAIAEFKADFDIALQGLGRGRWAGRVDNLEFGTYRHYGRLQQIIIADILGIGNYELCQHGFYHVSQLRGYAYYLMCRQLNGA